jgi:hypothetical protein
MMIDCASKDEAYYLCGLLSASCAVSFIHSRMVSTQIAPHVIQGLRISEFDSRDARHMRLAGLCERGHQVLQQRDSLESELLYELDELGSEIFGVPSKGARLLRQQLENGDAAATCSV